MSRLLAAALLLAPSAGVAGNAEWPAAFRAPEALVRAIEPPEGTAFAWETAHFRLFADRDIKPAALASFATVIESVPLLLESLPLPLWAPPEGEKPRIILFHDSLDYHSAGAAVGSTGFYDGRRRRVLIRADVFLNPPVAEPTRLRPRPDEDLLVHELVHLGMHDLLWRTNPWLFEGFAEYFAAAHTGRGIYDFAHMDRAIRDHLRHRLPPDAEGGSTLPALESLVALDAKQWIESARRADERLVYRPYAASLLLVHYHLHGAQRRAALDRHLRALLAHQDRRTPFPQLEGEPPATIEARLAAYWQPRGLAVRFGAP